MIRSFADEGTKDIFDGSNTLKARKKLNPSLWNTARKKLDMINAAKKLDDLKVPPGNRLEQLKGNYKGAYSIRINNQWRIIFYWDESGVENISILDYHRG